LRLANFSPLLASDVPVEVQTAALHLLRQAAKQHVTHKTIKTNETNESQAAMVAMVVNLLEQLDLDPMAEDAAAPQLAFEAWLALGELTARAPATFVVSERLLDQAALLSARDPYQLVACASALRDHPGALLGRWIAAVDKSVWQHVETPFVESQRVALVRGLAAAELKNAQPNEALFQDLAKQLTRAAPTGNWRSPLHWNNLPPAAPIWPNACSPTAPGVAFGNWPTRRGYRPRCRQR
jgi:hypothetical protein